MSLASARLCPRMCRGFSLAMVATAFVLLSTASTQTATTPIVTMIDLGTLGGTNSVAVAINTAGQVVGTSQIAGDATEHAFLWSPVTGIVDLGLIPGDDHDSTQAMAINGSGQVVGNSFNSFVGECCGDTGGRAFLWTAAAGITDLGAALGTPVGINANGQVVGNGPGGPGGALTASFWSRDTDVIRLPTLGGLGSLASALNDVGSVVGQSNLPCCLGRNFEPGHAFLWSVTNGIKDLGTLDPANPAAVSDAEAINDAGQVAGRSSGHGFVWTGNAGLMDFGDLGCFVNKGLAINTNGQVAGTTCATGPPRAFTWTATGGSVDLGTLGGTRSFGYALANTGQVVGEADLAGDIDLHAFTWLSATGMIDLGTLGGTFSRANAVNDGGQIVGYASWPGNHVLHAVLWQVNVPAQVLENLVAAVTGAGFQQAVHLLQNAQRSLDRNDLSATCGQLGAFVNQVEAQRGKRIALGTADLWMSLTMEVQRALTCR